MTRRCAALLVLVLLLFCACGRTQTAAPENSVAAPAAFSLPSLPDIGSYQPKKASYFYDAPLREFKASEEYGWVIPYKATADSQIPAFGFMTADGKIITAPVYSSIRSFVFGEKTVYAAEYKTECFTPGQKPEQKDDTVSYDETWFSGESPIDRQYHLISGDGGRLLTLPLNYSPRLDYDPGSFGRVSWIECGGASVETGSDVRFFYDFDLQPLRALSEYRPPEGWYAEALAENAGELVLAEYRDRYDEATDESKRQTRVLTFRNGSLQNKVELEDHIAALTDELLIGERYVYDRDGKTLLSLSSDAETLIEGQTGCCYIADPQKRELIRIKNSRAKKSVALPETVYGYDLACGEAAGNPCLLIKALPNADDAQYHAFDTDLRLLYTFDCAGAVESETLCDDGYRTVMYLEIVTGGKAEIYRLNGELLTSFAYDWELDTLWNNDDCVYYSGSDGSVRLFFPENGTTKEYTVSVPGTVGAVDEANAAFFVYRYWVPQGDDSSYDWRRNDMLRRLYDAQTGALLYDNVTEFQWMDTGGRQYCSFSCSGCTYVADKNLQVIAAIPDGYYA